MDQEYDKKFAEMKGYIPFLESMIQRLELSSSSSNPRQAQLDKIRSLRDLLLDKKKRMKMENLLKCEQVLVNLYAKVEQGDTLPGIQSAQESTSKSKEKSDLDSVRNKLKSVVKTIKEDPDTLPEIARASETEEVCTPGSKEPALFQRRPHKASPPKNSPTKSMSKGRVFTRVLKSPEPSDRRWSLAESNTDKPLFSRRSPRRSPRRHNPSYFKKDRGKSSRQNKPKDLNITLNVPEESLNSLNTEDILSRIINCSDGDVDIDTLRDLRSQILGELKQTGANDDISDLILKSYKKKKKRGKQKKEVEEGELSDSESEAIDSIYGSLIVVDKDKGTSIQTKSSEKDTRKIQICLVINSDKDNNIVQKEEYDNISNTDFEMLDDIQKPQQHEILKETEKINKIENPEENKKDSLEADKLITKSPSNKSPSKSQQEIITIDDDEELKDDKCTKPVTQNNIGDLSENLSSKKEETVDPPLFKANFYKPINEDKENPESVSKDSQAKTITKIDESKSCDKTEENTSTNVPPVVGQPSEKLTELESQNKEEIMTSPESPIVEIPLLNEPTVPAPPPKKDVVSEIDILQALKNEILSESITVAGSDTVTPALHQPKLTKVSSAQEIMKKKRISIEKYKQKSSTTPKPLFVKEPNSYLSKEDYAKKQSLKLTEKECERFNFPVKLALDESSDEDITNEYSLDDIYRDLAPESPEDEHFTETENESPVIIPADPVKAPTAATPDIDMRKMPLLPPAAATLSTTMVVMSPSVGNESPAIRNERLSEQNKRSPLVDPRVRRENRTMNLESPNPHLMNPDRTPRSANFPNMTPNARTYEMTPSRQSIDSDESTGKKHVYAPLFSTYEPRENKQQSESREIYKKQSQKVNWEPIAVANNESRRPRWEAENRDSRTWEDRNSRTSDVRVWEDRNIRSNDSRVWDDRDPRSSVHRDIDYQNSRYSESDHYRRGSRKDRFDNRVECPPTPSHSFGRSDCPATPTPSFGRLDAPMTPSHQFGRTECPTTPSHSFGRADCPPTPSHVFGRSECPTTPSHPFGRSDCPLTPIHPFGRSDIGMAPMTPSHPFGRPDFTQNSMNTASKFVKDPRLNRNDSDSSSHTFNDDSIYYQDRRKSDILSRHYNYSRRYSRDTSVGRDRNRSYDQSGRCYNPDQSSHYDSSIGRGNKDYETTSPYNRECGRGDDFRRETDYVRNSDETNRSFRQSHSVPSSSRHGRDYHDDNYSNKLSVKPQTGSSFTIDTSVSKTFQEFLNGKGIQVFDYSFDARRQRASSVGRSLNRECSVERRERESSVGRNISTPMFDNSKLMRKDFVRARSMGRDMKDIKTEKSLKDIKADFESYSANYKARTRIPKEKDQIEVPKKINYNSPRDRKMEKEKAIQEKSYASSKGIYSPRKNVRDPRMHRDSFEIKSRYKIDRRKTDGIVYSNDNIAKGTILGSGYGVKNYKIPKIKRVEPEVKLDSDKTKVTEITKTALNKNKEPNFKISDKKVDEYTSKSKVLDRKAKEIKENTKVKDSKFRVKGNEKTHNKNDRKTVIANKKQLDDDDLKSVTFETSNKFATRSSRKSKTTDAKPSTDDSVTKRRTRKSIIYDSDSDSEMTSKDNKDSDDETSNKTESPQKLASPSKTKKAENGDELDSSNFGIDDLEIFPDNMVSVPEIDNINALIADLDNDIDTSKQEESNNECTKEINLVKILNSFSSPDRPQDFTSDASFKDITEFIQEDLDRSNVQLIENRKEHSKDLENVKLINTEKNNVTEFLSHRNESIKNVPDATEAKNMSPKDCNQMQSNNFGNPEKELAKMMMDNDVIDSTTENYKKVSEKVEEKVPEDVNTTGRSLTPDSTINTEIQSADEKSLPDSTNEVQNEMHSDITSTEVPVDSSKDATDHSSTKQTLDKLDSIGNLLSILQDKSKIKELLSMLGDQSSDNEKIKKKLEKLSEIVSDDEDTNDSVNREQPHNEPNQQDITADDNFLEEIPDHSNTKNQTVNDSDITTKEHVCTSDDKTLEAIFDQSHTKNDTINDSDVTTKEHDSTSDDKTLETLLDQSNTKNDNAKDRDITNEKSIGEDDIIEETNQKEESTEVPKLEDEANDNEADNSLVSNVKKPRKVPLKRNKRGKWKAEKPVVRVTRQNANTVKKPKITRELKQLQDDIKEMFISNDVLNSTGIRMCRLAKLVDEKSTNREEEPVLPKEVKPVVVLEKFKGTEDALLAVKTKKKLSPKTKEKVSTENAYVEDTKEQPKQVPKYKPGPKSKTKPQQLETDPYSFDPDSANETNTSKETENEVQNSSDSDNDSLSSSKSFGSSEVLAELKKKPKRKRNSWKSGVINKPKRKKKEVAKENNTSLVDDKNTSHKNEAEDEDDKSTTKVNVPDPNCFTDKTYCFSRDVTVYSCRLCHFSGSDIVHHYKRNHPHSEIPLSRMSPKIAKEAIDQCEDINFEAICKIDTSKRICRFCFKEFTGRGRGKSGKLEEFFWHVVSTHTGEYKQLCSECINVTRCPFNLDIPPPPKEVKGQLIGYICGKCHFTQISLENLKTHVIVRHNDEQTAVYTINLGVMTKKTMEALMNYSESTQSIEQPRVLRSGRSNQSVTDTSDARSEITDSTDLNSDLESVRRRLKTDEGAIAANSASKISFENDLNSESSNTESTKVKVETDDNENENHLIDNRSETQDDNGPETENYRRPVSDDIFDCAHFKVSYTETGMKEYVCCVYGKDNHYKTSLLISMKKHIQHKHSEKWDGYCYVCKLIVTPQGDHRFKECFQHYLDQHIDNFPILKQVKPIETPESVPESITASAEMISAQSYINVRPMSDLIAQANEPPENDSVTLPVIESVISLGTASTPQAPSPGPSSIYSEPLNTHDLPEISPQYMPEISPQQIPQKPFKYEEAQAEVMSKKLRAVLDTMLSADKLVKIFKCAGRFCSFSSDSAEDALLHASTHQRIGGENALTCAYCDFDCAGNAIDLVMHVFKTHGCCQYVCRQCFYRASSSQLVYAHMLRMHGSEAAKQSVLMTDIVTPVVDDRSEILSRDVAVQSYVCQDMETMCKFKTFTQGKFCEHLFSKHKPPYLCFECTEGFLTPMELTNHQKTHGLKLYQCTWCIHGAENETELLAHASEKHPTKRPQAYLRIITSNKDSKFKMMTLPLAQLNKLNVKVETVVQTPNRTESPLRDAERSIELERLIGSMPSFEPKPVETPKEPEPASPEILPELPSSSDLLLESMEPRLSTPPPMTSSGDIQLSTQTTPVLKKELNETPEKDTSKSDVICLDSDEEDSRDSKPGSAAISEEATKETNTAERIVPRLLYTCSKCLNIYKTRPTFKRHIFSSPCFKNQDDKIKCAHCSFIGTKEATYFHYDSHDIRLRQDRFECGVCSYSSSLRELNSHAFTAHGSKNVSVTSEKDDSGKFIYIVTPKTGPKRKLSAGKIDTPPKKTRYSPPEVHQLPTKPILDELVYCSLCEFSTKVRLNMVRHLQQHAEQQPVAQTVPVNPVPHLESNEMHFDKMVNLASSSIVTRAPDKPSRVESTPTVNLVIPPEAASRYPKYVPEKQRHTCGAKGCSYTSLNEGMLKYHWEALHTGTIDFHCVHCPPYQHLDTSKPLTASRIIAHLKMHDIRLYACSSCTYYHYKRQVLEKHLHEVHKGAGQVMVVREEAVTQTPAVSQPAAPAPTMDLKPWQCGLCKFKSMLRPEVIEHCAKFHNTKMQFKCPNCPFRGSNLENVTKHQQNSHPGSTEETFYYYYREGSIPDLVDGMPRWVKQRQKMAVPDSEVKTEVPDNTTQIGPPPLVPIAPGPPPLLPISPVVDINIVKKEIVERVDESIEELCVRFGQFCEPNGLKYKCPLCKIVIEDSKEAMQSHLFEELKYRKWGCSKCSYKAFHTTGLNEHMLTEHNIRQNQLPVELPVDIRVEKWVAKLLDHQTAAMEKNKENLSKQRIQVEKPTTTTTIVPKPPETSKIDKPRTKELEDAFGMFGEAKNNQYCCPKCDFQNKDESAMRDHLESELNQIRWRCSNCSNNYQNYHEAQLHCKSVHAGESSRPIDAARDPALRTAWINAVLDTQKTSINIDTEDNSESMETPALDNSLLVVRYEERVPTPEASMLSRRKRSAPTASTSATADSDDERLFIDEDSDSDDSDKTQTPEKQDKKKTEGFECAYCGYTSKYKQVFEDHTFRHYNQNPYKCDYCDYTCYVANKVGHHTKCHPDKPYSFSRNKLPEGPPARIKLTNHKSKVKKVEPAPKVDPKPKDDGPQVICLYCEKAMSDIQAKTHGHEGKLVQFGKKGEAVVKCCICFALLLNVTSMLEHHNLNHSTETINYAFYKLHYDSREIYQCGNCDRRFKLLSDCRSHHNASHSSLQLKYVTKPHLHGYEECEEAKDKRKSEDNNIYPSAKRIAKKSTAKPPGLISISNLTTKQNNDEDSESEVEEYSYSGTLAAKKS